MKALLNTVTRLAGRKLLAPGMVGLAMSGISQDLMAGGYVFAGETNGVDVIAHPSPYTGSGGVITVRICVVPGSPNANQIEAAIQNNVAVLNQMLPTLGNLKRNAKNNIPSGFLDFESVSLHEIGHCLGLSHVNASSESGLSGNNLNYTKATNGVNNVFDIDAGADGVIGSADDVRGDDVNLIFFNRANNDPFSIPAVVDSTTYSRNVADLPAGDLFAANGDRAVSTLLGYPLTESVMQQGTFYDEAQRRLAPDDVSALRYAQSGVDSLESGTTDNYSVVYEYGGISAAANCDINVGFTNTSGFAFCQVAGTFIAPNHARVTTAPIEFGQSYNWFFNTLNNPPQIAATPDTTVFEGNSTQLTLSASDADGDSLSFVLNNLPGFTGFTDNGDGTATVTVSPAAGDAGNYSVGITVTDSGDPALQAESSFNLIVAVDTDGDGLSDADEVNIYGTDPLLADTDGDFFGDGFEVAFGSDPANALSWPAIADGDVAPLGSPDGLVNGADLLVMERIAVGDTVPTSLELGHGDLYPAGAPDGVIDLSDLLLLRQQVITP